MLPVHSDEPHKHRPHSLTPSVRRGERPPLRSSPLAGPSYAADGVGNVIQHSSALEEEIARRRRSGLLNEDDIVGLDALSTPALSRKASADIDEPTGSPRRARPSFISLTPAPSRPGSRGSISTRPQTPQSPSPASSPMLRTRHSSPHLAADAEADKLQPAVPPRPSTADWMTAAPAPSFSRLAARNAGVVLPVKADSRAGDRIRRKSTPASPRPPKPTSQPARSIKSFRSMNRLFKGPEEVPPVPAVVTPGSGRSRASSIASRTSLGDVKLHVPATPTDDSDPKVVIHVSEPLGQIDKEPEMEPERQGRVKRLWAKVVGGVKKSKVQA